MAIENYLGVPIHSFTDLKHRLSYRDKRANNWKWVEDWVDYYDNSYSIMDDPAEYDKILLNYRLYNGRGVYITQPQGIINSKALEAEGYYFSEEDIPHYDIITPIAKSLHGQQQLMAFKPIVTDSSLTNVTLREKRKLSLMQEYINETVINPIKEQAFKEWSLENGIEDPATLSPEQQQEAQQQIQQREKALTPKDIERHMASEYKSPSETQLQQITEFTIKRDKLKFWTDENFKHMLISGKQVYETGIMHNKAYTRILNPLGFTCGGPSDAHFIEDMDWAKYEEYITIPQLFNEYGHIMTSKDIKKLNTLEFPRSVTRTRGEFPEPMNTKIAEFDAQTGFFDYAPRINTKEGQDFVAALHAKFGNNSYAETEGIRRVKVAYKSLRKLKLVDRYDKENNKYTQFWVDDSYERNPKKDIKVREVYLPHIYVGDKVGYGSGDSCMYFNKGPMPHQYSSMNNPWNVKLPFMGVEYSKLFGNTQNVAPLDLAKPWQDKFNIKLARINEIEATDVGKIFAVATSLKPKDWSFGKWMMMAKYGKLLPLDSSNEEVQGMDASMFKQFDLSQMMDIAGHLQHLDWIRNQAALAMSYNPARLGQIVPQAAVRNTEQNITQSTYQTQDLFTLHNEMVERVLNRHILNERAALKDNDFIASYVLDDLSRADLKVDKELFNLAEIGISLRNSSEDFNTLNSIKQLGQAMIQNQMITFPELIRLQLSNNMADALNIAERAEEKMLQRQEEAMQQQQQQQDQMMQMQKEMQQIQAQLDAEQKQLDRENKLQTATIGAMQMANQQDIDQNAQADSIQKEMFTKEQEAIEKAKDREHQTKIKDKELANAIEIKKLELKAKATAARSK